MEKNMNRKRRGGLLLCFFLFVGMPIVAEDEHLFPTGTEWKEIMVELGYPLDSTQFNLYKIESDTIIGGKEYKKVSVNGLETDIWVKENENKVWLFSKELPGEILLYDFNWDGMRPWGCEYFQEAGEADAQGTIHYEESSLDSERYYTSVCEDGPRALYIGNTGVIFNGIGRVSELNRNSCVLGYRIPFHIPPGLIYWKVLWFKRDGKIIFRSSKAEEWISDYPVGIEEVGSRPTPSPSLRKEVIYDLQGRRLQKVPEKGLYIQDGKKKTHP